jgi:2'-5' RNA ligase
MKLIELAKKDEDDTRTVGTYAGYHFNKADIESIRSWAKNNGIPNLVPSEKMHTTLLYSRKPCPDYKPLGKLDKEIPARIGDMENWPTKDGKNALIVRLKCDTMVKRHNHLMKELDATYDYDEYKPHITLSYDVGKDFDLKAFPQLKDSIKKIGAVEEYREELVDDWQNK